MRVRFSRNTQMDLGPDYFHHNARSTGFSTMARLERALPGRAPEPSVGTRVIFGIWAYVHTLTEQPPKSTRASQVCRTGGATTSHRLVACDSPSYSPRLPSRLVLDP